MTNLLKLFLNLGMPMLEQNLKYQTAEVEKIVKGMQSKLLFLPQFKFSTLSFTEKLIKFCIISSSAGTRAMHQICCEATKNKDVALIKLVPPAKTALEKFVYSVKVMLVSNKSADAFWMGNLKNKDLQGEAILSQVC